MTPSPPCPSDAERIAELFDDILMWSDRLASHLFGIEAHEFKDDLLLFDATCRCVEIVGEAAGRILKLGGGDGDAQLERSLRLASRTRNVLAHGYAIVDVPTVWLTATKSVPDLASHVRVHLARKRGEARSAP